LGGLGQTSVGGGQGQTSRSADSGPVLDQELPPELNELVVKFVEHMKKQKDHQKQIMHFSDKNMQKVGDEMRQIKHQISQVHMAIQRDRQNSSKLRHDNHKTLEFAEVAQQTSEVPPSLQYENNAPMRYFSCVADDFEAKMSHFSRQISELESHLGSAQLESGLDPNVIVSILQVQHKAFVTLAAQLQLIHGQVQDRCSEYLQYRRIHFSDTTDVFTERRKRKKLNSSREVKKGPSPFRLSQALSLNSVQPPHTHQGLGHLHTQQGLGHPLMAQPALGQKTFNTSLHAGVPQPTGLTAGQQLVSTGSTMRLGTPFPGPSLAVKLPTSANPPPAVGLNQSKPLVGTSGKEFQLQPPPIAKKKSVN
jgi:nucleoporin p58/p45